MGYTRYFEIYQKLEPNQFEKFSQDCKVICDEITKQFGHGLASWDGEGDPEFTSTEIIFNGIGEDAHETFAIGV
jgi:hypothetical protein